MGTQVYPDPNSQIPASFEKSLELAVKMLFEVVTSPTANAMLSGLAGALALAGVKNSCAVPLSVSALHQESVKLAGIWELGSGYTCVPIPSGTLTWTAVKN